MQFYIIGSKSSTEIDAVVIVNQVSDDLDFNKRLTGQFENSLKRILKTEKKININIAQIDSGYVSKVYKGTFDEVNNCIFSTYEDHKQYLPLKIKGLLDRNVDLKIVRSVRTILSLLSKTQYRDFVKESLKKEDFLTRINTLSDIDLCKIKEFGKCYSEQEILKKIAFQIGQVLGLLEVKELYSKEDISVAYTNLKPYLMRQYQDRTALQAELIRFACKLKNNYPNMSQKKE